MFLLYLQLCREMTFLGFFIEKKLFPEYIYLYLIFFRIWVYIFFSSRFDE